MKRTIILVPIFALVLAGCGARQALPVAEQSPLDDRLSCGHLQGELAANEARLVELRDESERRGRDSFGMILAAGATGLLFLDDGSTQRSETEALGRRNERLRAMIGGRPCRA